MPVALFDLPDALTTRVATWLLIDDVVQLRSVCRAASAASTVYESATLVLPPTDQRRARRLVTSIYARDRGVFTRFAYIQITSPWHIDLLNELDVAGLVRGLRIRNGRDDGDDVADLASRTALDGVCRRLSEFPRLTKLDLSGTTVEDVGPLGDLRALRYLDLSETLLQDPTPLAGLTKLEVLLLRGVDVFDMRCIERMTELRHVEATHPRHRPPRRYVVFPSFRQLTKLQSLRTQMMQIPSLADWTHSLCGLQQLTLDWFVTQDHETITLHDLLSALPRLERLDRSVHTVDSAVVAHNTSLRVIAAKLSGDYDALASLQQLEELVLAPWSPLVANNNYDVLRRLPRLRKVTIDQTDWYKMGRNAMAAESRRLAEAIANVPQLESLRVVRVADDAIPVRLVSRLRHLQHLDVSDALHIQSLEWLRPCTTLRSLTLSFRSCLLDVSPLSALVQLESLALTHRWATRGERYDLSFLWRMPNLLTLSLDGYIDNLAGIQRLTKLRKLSLRSTAGKSIDHVEALGCLVRLRELDVVQTTITDLAPLVQLQHLRRVTISPQADCRALAECDHPSLLELLHPEHNCLWFCSSRNEMAAEVTQEKSPYAHRQRTWRPRKHRPRRQPTNTAE